MNQCKLTNSVPKSWDIEYHLLAQEQKKSRPVMIQPMFDNEIRPVQIL